MKIKIIPQGFILALFSVLTVISGCTKQLQDQPHEQQYVNYTLSFSAQGETRVLPLSDAEKAIKSVFVAIYDDKGKLLECLTSQGEQVDIRVASNATTVYAIANVLSNSLYEYYCDGVLIDFNGDKALLKGYFDDLGRQGKITVRHKCNEDGNFVVQNTDPLPMCGQSAIARATPTIQVAMRMMVARLEIVNLNPANKVSSIKVEKLINNAIVATTQPVAANTVVGNSSLLTSYPTPTSLDKMVYYIPENWGAEPVTLTIDYQDDKSAMQQIVRSFQRLLGGKYYIQNIVSPQMSAISLDVTSIDKAYYAGQTVEVALLSVRDWRVESKPDWVQLNKVSGSGSMNSTPIEVTVAKNASVARSGNVVFADDTGAKAELAISQDGEPAFLFIPPSDYQSVPSRSVGYSNKWNLFGTTVAPCLISSDASWIQWSYDGGRKYWITDGQAATFTYSENTSRTPRRAIVKLHKAEPGLVPGLVYDYREVVQMGATDYLTASQTEFDARSKGESYDLSIEHNAPLRIGALPAWITLVEGATVNSVTSYKLEVSKNNLKTQRQGSISVEMDTPGGVKSLTLSVTQQPGFTQTYPFNLQYSIMVKATARQVSGNVFVGANGMYQNYANTVVVYLPTGETGQVKKSTYGFVTDPPHATSIQTTPFSDDVTSVARYDGTTQAAILAKVGVSASASTYFRNAEVPITIPAGLTSDDKLLITIELTDMLFFPLDFKYNVKYEIL